MNKQQLILVTLKKLHQQTILKENEPLTYHYSTSIKVDVFHYCTSGKIQYDQSQQISWMTGITHVHIMLYKYELSLYVFVLKTFANVQK